MSKKLFWVLLVSGIVVFIGGPLLVQYIRRPIGTTGNGDWLGFWGSYLGVIPSGLIAYFVAKFQIGEQKKVDRQQKNREVYLRDLKIFYRLLHDMRSFIIDINTIQSNKFPTLTGKPVDSDRIARMLYNSLNETKYGLRAYVDIYIFSQSLPVDGASDIKSKAGDLSKEMESVSTDVEMRVLEIQAGGQRLYNDDQFKQSVLEQAKNLTTDYAQLESLVKREIEKYYNLND